MDDLIQQIVDRAEPVIPKPKEGCHICGCKGVHACMGRPPEPWTPDKIKELEIALSKYETMPDISGRDWYAAAGQTWGPVVCHSEPEVLTKEKLQALVDKLLNQNLTYSPVYIGVNLQDT